MSDAPAAPAEPKPEGAEPITIRVRDQVRAIQKEACPLKSGIRDGMLSIQSINRMEFGVYETVRRFYTSAPVFQHCGQAWHSRRRPKPYSFIRFITTLDDQHYKMNQMPSTNGGSRYPFQLLNL
jgi:hypothetical protein